MKITIQEAIKAMDNGKKAKCLADGVVYTNESTDCSFSKYQVESDWEIVEQEDDLMPCIYCHSEMKIIVGVYSKRVWGQCMDFDDCESNTSFYDSKEELIRKYRAIYNKLNPLKLDIVKESSC